MAIYNEVHIFLVTHLTGRCSFPSAQGLGNKGEPTLPFHTEALMKDQPFFLGAFLGIFSMKRLHPLVKKQDLPIPFSLPAPHSFPVEFNESCHLAFGSGNPNILVLRDSPATCKSCLSISAHNKVRGSLHASGSQLPEVKYPPEVVVSS